MFHELIIIELPASFTTQMRTEYLRTARVLMGESNATMSDARRDVRAMEKDPTGYIRVGYTENPQIAKRAESYLNESGFTTEIWVNEEEPSSLVSPPDKSMTDVPQRLALLTLGVLSGNPLAANALLNSMADILGEADDGPHAVAAKTLDSVFSLREVLDTLRRPDG